MTSSFSNNDYNDFHNLDEGKEPGTSEFHSLSTSYCLESSSESYPTKNTSQTLDEISPCTYSTSNQNSTKGQKRPRSKKGQNSLKNFKKQSKPRDKKQPKDCIEISPKKEYVRIKTIRGHKKIIRQILIGVKYPPKTTINKIERNNFEQFEAWNLLMNNTKANSSALEKICQTHQGPLTDGKSYRNEENKGDQVQQEKTFNDAFIKNYFSNSAVVENFELYVDYLFANQSSKSLKKKFGFYCCATHGCNTCSDKWESLRVFVRDFTMCSGFDVVDDCMDENDWGCMMFENEEMDFDN